MTPIFDLPILGKVRWRRGSWPSCWVWEVIMTSHACSHNDYNVRMKIAVTLKNLAAGRQKKTLTPMAAAVMSTRKWP
ncbi:hypothetical protein QN277_018008 [Acacia crassicarpa]|uniref:Uncharacterized protein n=1 Tax=Acacia crassicarpa TaxID=499986 RepID=A0AAE1MUF6_9FABA|nr:hypothetical protein QN277_018008 [Acacia crassicarpa]